MTRTEGSSGFTLIELLVVLAIFAILTGMLLPAVLKAKGHSQTIDCLNNQRQMAYASFMYTGDNEDILQLTVLSELAAGPPFHGLPGSWVLGNAVVDVDPTNLQSGTLYRYLNSIPIYRCPPDKKLAEPRSGKKLPVIRSYYVNFDLNAVGGYMVTNKAPEPFTFVTKLSSIVAPSPSRVWVYTENNRLKTGEPVSPLNILQTLPHQYWADAPADRHSMGCNFSFADAHALYHRWKTPKDSYYGPPIASGGDRDDYNWVLNGIPRTTDTLPLGSSGE
jgi:prepilin-type N-terminal cleavage/methylation domain-containing protein